MMAVHPRAESAAPPDAPFFVTGGSLPDDAPSYVARQADEDLLAGLSQGEFCYVLDTRQVGKSSLMVRTAARLRARGCCVAVLDLSALGQNVSPEQWYLGLLYSLAGQTGLEDELEAFWEAHAALGPAQRWVAAVREVVLERLADPVVVFVDETDAVLSLPFSADEFFAAIRECHNRRPHDIAFRRLTFCLLGVADPSDLIRNPRTTPFNIGRRTELSDFTSAEAELLGHGLGHDARRADGQGALLSRVLHWTGGHPYLTQRLCSAVAEEQARCAADVDRLCGALFLSRRGQQTDPNLTFARDRLLSGEQEGGVTSVLALYDRVLLGRAVPADSTDPRVNALRLAGVVRVSGGTLAVRNRLYGRVFDRRWVRDRMPGEELRRQRLAMWRGIGRASLVWAVLLLAVVFGALQMRRARDLARTASLANSRAVRVEREKARLTDSVGALRDAHDRLLATNRVADERLARARSAYELTLRRRDQVESDLARARRQVAAEQARGLRSQRYIDSMSGRIASAFAIQPEAGYEALKYGLHAVEQAVRKGNRPSEEAAKGLVDAVDRDVFRRFVLPHDAAVTSLGFSPDGRRLLTAGKGLYACVWSVQTGGPLQRLRIQSRPGPYQAVNTAEFSPDGRRILIASDETGVSVWDATSTAPVQTSPLMRLPRQKVQVQCAAFSPDGVWIAMLAEDRNVLMYNIRTGQSHLLCRNPADRHTGFLWCVAFSHRGNAVATGADDGTAKVWEVATGRLVTTYDRHLDRDDKQNAVLSLTFDQTDTFLMSTGKDGCARLWWWSSNALYRKFAGRRQWLWCGDVSDGRLFVVTGGKDGRVGIWAFSNDQAPLYSLDSHRGAVYCARFSPLGDLVATGSADRTVEIWQFRHPQEFTTGAAMTYAEYSRDGAMAVSASEDSYARVARFAGPTGLSLIGKAPVNHATFSPDGKLLATAEGRGAVRLWDTGLPAGDRRDYLRELAGHQGPVNGLAFSPDGGTLASAGKDGTLRLWGVRTGRPVRVWMGHQGGAQSVVFSLDGRELLSAGLDGSAATWDVRSGALIRRFVPAAHPGLALGDGGLHPWEACYSPDGRFVVTAETDGGVYVFDRRGGRVVRRIEAHAGDAYSVCFNRSGTSMLTAGADARVQVWSAADVLSPVGPASAVRPTLTISCHHDKVLSARFSPDGQSIITASKDNTAGTFPATLEGYVRRAREILAARPRHQAVAAP